MRQIFQKLLGGLGATVPVQMMKGRDGSDVQDSCHLQTSIDFVTPKVLTQPYWRYFAGVEATPDQAENWATNLLRAGVLGGGNTVNLFTEHGAGTIFWTAPAGRYNLSESTLSPAMQIVRLKTKEEMDTQLVRIVKTVESDLEKVVPIPQIAYFPKDDEELLRELISYPIAAAAGKYNIIIPDATEVEINRIVSTWLGWQLIGEVHLGQGNTSAEGFPQCGGPGVTGNVWMYPLY